MPHTPTRSPVSPMIYCKDAAKVLDFMKAALDATEARRPLFRANGDLWNAEVTIAGCTVMLGEASEGMHFPGFINLAVADPDAAYAKAIAAGASPIMPPEDRFYGERDGGVMDPQGNFWWFAGAVEDLTDDEIEAGARRAEAEGGAA